VVVIKKVFETLIIKMMLITLSVDDGVERFDEKF